MTNPHPMHVHDLPSLSGTGVIRHRPHHCDPVRTTIRSIQRRHQLAAGHRPVHLDGRPLGLQARQHRIGRLAHRLQVALQQHGAAAIVAHQLAVIGAGYAVVVQQIECVRHRRPLGGAEELVHEAVEQYDAEALRVEALLHQFDAAREHRVRTNG